MTAMPTPEELKNRLLKWDIKYNSRHENNTIFLKEEGMKLGLGGIGQDLLLTK
jgi:thiamine biosynthesis lipoprotein